VISESQARKNKSITLLFEQGVPFIDHLPEIEDSTKAVLRAPKEIAERARCLFAVFFAVNRGEQSKALEIVERFNLSSKLSLREQFVLRSNAPPDAILADLSWECESLISLVWALGAIDAMPPPTDGIHPYSLALGWTLITEEHWVGSSARQLGDVLDQCDLYYRYHWAVRDAWLKRSPVPAGLISGAISKRHRALNWLTSNELNDWDEVTTDT
jgi:hypothetical protein